LRESSINYLKRHRDLRQADILLARGISEDDLLLPENEKVRRIRRMIREVGTEYHYLKSFIRFEEPRRGILVGYASPKHRIKQMLADHFAHRFPGNLIVVGDERSFCLSLLSERGRLRVEVKGSIKVLRRELGCGGRMRGVCSGSLTTLASTNPGEEIWGCSKGGCLRGTEERSN